MRPSQDGHALSRQGYKGSPVSGAPVSGVVNVHQGITPGGSPQVLSVKALRSTEKKITIIIIIIIIFLIQNHASYDKVYHCWHNS